MITIPNPQTKQWSQLNKGDLFGTLYSTRNIDLDTPGILKLAQRTRVLGSTTSNPFLDVSCIVFGNFESSTSNYSVYWILSNSLYTLSYDLTSFAVDAKANTPSLSAYSDGCNWNNDLYVTKGSRIAKLSAGTWTTDWSSASFTTGLYPNHPIEPNVTNTNLLVGDGNLLKKVIADGTITTALTFPSNYGVKWIRRGVNANFIALESIGGGGSVASGSGAYGAIAIWDGLDTTIEANYLIPLNSKAALSGCLDEEGVFHIIQDDGRLMRYNGSGFAYEAELPIFRDYVMRYNWGDNFTLGRGITRRGMCLIKGRIHIYLNAYNDRDPQAVPNFQSGVWVYDKDNKAFYQKYSISNSTTVTEFGQSKGTLLMSGISPIFMDSPGVPSSSVGGTLLAAGRVTNNDYSGDIRVIVSVATGENRGQFVINRIESQEVTDDAISLWCKFEGVNSATDKIIFKYRTSKRDPMFIDGTSVPTWTSTTTFTSNDVKFALASVGDEIQIMEGNGSGGTCHISSIAYSAPTYTITVDEAITGIAAGNKGRMFIENWKKLSTQITYTDTLGYKNIPLPISNKAWFQIKGELRGEGGVVGIRELQIVNNTNIPYE